MIELHYEDRGGERIAEIEALGLLAVQRCTLELWKSCTFAVSKPNPPPYTNPSLPGEAPHLRTGQGQRNIAYEIVPEKLTGRVGVRQQGRYMAFLDIGTKRCKARPWLLATAKKIWTRLQAIAKGEG